MTQSSLQTHPREDMMHSTWLRTVRRIASFAASCLAAVSFLSSCTTTQTAAPKADADYSNYDVPLEEQMKNHIRTKVMARLGEGKNTHDRFFIIPLAYQNDGNDPEYSHSFMSVIRVLADDKQPRLTPGIEKRTYKDRNFQAFTISWLPHDFMQNPHLCIFKGFGARLVPSMNKCPVSVGRDFTLEETLQLAANDKLAVCMWGPYEISEPAFDIVVKRLRLLEGGTIKYRADDRIYRKDRTAINCFHAMANIYDLYPNGGLFGTGFNMWGFNGTERVLIEYKDRATGKGYLLEPVDEKNDRYGFFYAPTRSEGNVYNPFKAGSAYHR